MSAMFTWTLVFALAMSLLGFIVNLVGFHQSPRDFALFPNERQEYCVKWMRRYFLATVFFSGALTVWLYQ